MLFPPFLPNLATPSNGKYLRPPATRNHPCLPPAFPTHSIPLPYIAKQPPPDTPCAQVPCGSLHRTAQPLHTPFIAPRPLSPLPIPSDHPPLPSHPTPSMPCHATPPAPSHHPPTSLQHPVTTLPPSLRCPRSTLPQRLRPFRFIAPGTLQPSTPTPPPPAPTHKNPPTTHTITPLAVSNPASTLPPPRHLPFSCGTAGCSTTPTGRSCASSSATCDGGWTSTNSTVSGLMALRPCCTTTTAST